MALADDLKDLDRRIAVTFERTLADFRRRLASRLKEEGEATLRALDELAPTLPERMLADDDLAAVASDARAVGRQAAVDDLLRIARRLDRGGDQVEILSALLEESARYASRTALVLCSSEGLRGWAAAGFGAGLRSIDDLSFAAPPTPAWQALYAGEGVTPLSADDCTPLCRALDAPLPQNGALIPFVLADAIAAGLYADRLEDATLDVAALQLLTHLAALDVELLGLRKRARTPTLYEPGELSGEGLAVWQAPPAEEPQAAAPPEVPAAPEPPAVSIAGAVVAPSEPPPVDTAALATPPADEAEAVPAEAWDDVDTTAEPSVEVVPELDELPELPELPEADDAEEAPWESVETNEEPVAAAWQATGRAEELAAPELAEIADEPTTVLPEEATTLSEPSWEAIEDMPTSEMSLRPEGDRAAWTEPATPLPAPEEEAGEAEERDVSFDATVAVSSDVMRRRAQMPPSGEGAPVVGWDTAETPPPAAPPTPPEPDVSEDETVLLQRSVPAAPPTEPAPPLANAAEEGGDKGADAQVLPPTDLQGPGWAFTGGRPAAGSDDPAFEEARRLARLLVSEIKLYNEEHVEEGRRNHDIYERLREDIDRSRQMYEERVDPKVRDHDFFHEALVRVLAGGDAKALGT